MDALMYLKKILYYLFSQKLKCALKKHMQKTGFPGWFGGSGQAFRVLREEGKSERELSPQRKEGEWARRESASWSSAGRKQKQVQRGAKTPCWVPELPRLFLHFHHTLWGSGSNHMPRGDLGAMKMLSSPRSPVPFDNWNFTGEVDETSLWWNHGTWSRYRYEKGEGGLGQ